MVFDRFSACAAPTSIDSRLGKYHSTALLGSCPNVFARFAIGVTSPSTQSRGSPVVASDPARTWIRASAFGDVEASNA